MEMKVFSFWTWIINQGNSIQFINFITCFSLPIFKRLDFDPKYFWAWTDFQSYLDFMLAVWFVGAIITYFMLPFTLFMESVGFMAVFIEAMLGKINRFDQSDQEINRQISIVPSLNCFFLHIHQVHRNFCETSRINQHKEWA